MHFTLSWKSGLLTAVATAVVGLAFFVFVSSKIDYSCHNITPVSGGCRVYNGLSTVTQGYGDFWLQFFAPTCVDGLGPDECIGPAIAVMFFTLTVAGFLIGGLSRVSADPIIYAYKEKIGRV